MHKLGQLPIKLARYNKVCIIYIIYTLLGIGIIKQISQNIFTCITHTWPKFAYCFAWIYEMSLHG